MSIQAVLDKLVTITPQSIAGLAYCGEGGGLVDSDESRRVQVKSPSVLYSALTARSLPDRGDERLNIEWLCAAYCLVAQKSDNGKKPVRALRNAKARALAEQVALLVNSTRFGAGTRKPSDIALFEMSDGSDTDLDKQGLSGYAVTWRQGVAVGTDIWADDGVPPTEIWLGMSPMIGQKYIDWYWRIHEAPKEGLLQ